MTATREAIVLPASFLTVALLGGVRLLHVLEIGLLVDVEVRVHGFVGDDRRQHDRGVDQVAGRHDRA